MVAACEQLQIATRGEISRNSRQKARFRSSLGVATLCMKLTGMHMPTHSMVHVVMPAALMGASIPVEVENCVDSVLHGAQAQPTVSASSVESDTGWRSSTRP